MKKWLALLFSIVLLFSLTAAAPQEKELVEGRTGLTIYTHFIAGLRSGRMQKLHFNFASLLDFFGSSSTTIQFCENANEKRELLYREHSLFVFWSLPPYDYYDGETYYYKHDNDWFSDEYSKYDNVQKKDFVGIKEQFFTGNTILSDQVFRNGTGYRLETKVQSIDQSVYYSLLGETDENFQFSKIIIRQYRYDFLDEKYTYVGTYVFRYHDVNLGLAVNPPKDLHFESVENDVGAASAAA